MIFSDFFCSIIMIFSDFFFVAGSAAVYVGLIHINVPIDHFIIYTLSSILSVFIIYINMIFF